MFINQHFPEAHSNGVLTFPYNIGIMLLFAQGEAVWKVFTVKIVLNGVNNVNSVKRY